MALYLYIFQAGVELYRSNRKISRRHSCNSMGISYFSSPLLYVKSILLDKYTVDGIESFQKEKFKDLGKTYSESDLGARRVLLVSIAPAGLHLQYPGYSKQEIGSLYQSIRDVQTSHLARVPHDYILTNTIIDDFVDTLKDWNIVFQQYPL